MKRLAIISYWYPPNRAIGALRIAKFAKYLPEFGWEPFVVTVQPGTRRYQGAGALRDELSAGQIWRTADRSLPTLLAGLLPRQTAQAAEDGAAHAPSAVARAAYAVYRQVLCFPDECWPWLWEYRQIRRAVRSAQPDAILSSSPPATTHILASRLSRQLQLPWVADFRDPWSQSHTIPRIAPLSVAERWLERQTLRAAAAITTVSPPLADALAALHGRSVSVIWNGHDGEAGESQAPTRVGPFRMVHTGLLYPRTRDPRPIFEALDRLVVSGNVALGGFRLSFFGRNLWVAREALEAFPRVAPLVELGGELPYRDALDRQQQATALLLLEWADARAKGVVTGKLFEYLQTGRPVLATGPRGGAIDTLLKETAGGVLCTNAGEVESVLRGWLTAHASGEAIAGALPHLIERYSRRAQTAALAETLDRVAGVELAAR